MSNKITHPYLPMKCADIPDELVLAYIFKVGYDNKVDVKGMHEYFNKVYPRPLVFRKLQILQRRGYTREDAFGNWSLTNYGFYTINKLCGGFSRIDKDGNSY